MSDNNRRPKVKTLKVKELANYVIIKQLQNEKT